MRNTFLVLKPTLAILFLICYLSPSFAHEGHDHEAPITLKAPKGGLIKGLDHSRVEVISKGKNIKIFIYDTDMKPANISDYKITAKAEIPRKKIVEDIPLFAKETFYEGVYDAKGAHRYSLKIELVDLKYKQTDKISFNIEPKR